MLASKWCNRPRELPSCYAFLAHSQFTDMLRLDFVIEFTLLSL